jgi:hypothetical protein
MSTPDGDAEFIRLLIAARNSGVDSLVDRWLKGWRPKNANAQELAMDRLLKELPDASRDDLIAGVRYFIDLAFFKALCVLEEGEGPWDFELLMRNRASSETTPLVEADRDHDLRSAYLMSLEREGH